MRRERTGGAEVAAAVALSELYRPQPEAICAAAVRSGSARGALAEILPGASGASPDRLETLARRGIRALGFGSPDYPSRLRELEVPPFALYLKGPATAEPDRSVAIIGTRRATPYGRRMAGDLASGLARYGVTVVSGLARGIDLAAHRGALDAGGITMGVLGCGLDHVAPPSAAPQYLEMARRGLLVSEFAPETPPAPRNFPRRNRIIAALADAVIVVQAGARSGTSITVGYALELNRPVFGVPGPVGPEASRGVHDLLRQGAILAAGVSDVIEDMGWGPRAEEARGGHEGAAARLLAALADGACTAEELAVAGGLEIGPTLALVSRLELDGMVTDVGGGRFALPARTNA